MKLTVLAQYQGTFTTVGHLETFPGSGGEFVYDTDWLDIPDTPSLSLSLPARTELYRTKQIQPYFEGLLPEEDTRRQIARELGISPHSFLKLLEAIAGECIGAVTITSEEAAAITPELAPLTSQGMAALAAPSGIGASHHAAHARLSLAGAQSKTGLYRNPNNPNEWFTPLGSAPSTHIVKPQNPRFEDLCQNEHWVLSLARSCNLPCAASEIIETDAGPLLAIERYDRVFPDTPTLVNGYPIPLRLHQEDLSQALGIPLWEKYESGASSYLSSIANLLRDHTTSPIDSQRSLVQILVFNVIVGNCDAHLKNYSLLRSPDWQKISLAPAYDLVSTTAYEELSHELGMRIGNARYIDNVDKESFKELAKQINMSASTVLSIVDETCQKLAEKLIGQESDSSVVERGIAQAKKRLGAFA